MPIYEYRCKKCGHEFELMRAFSESSSPTPCPKCGGDSDKLVSGFGSQIGFYVRAPRAPFRQTKDKAKQDD